MTPLEEVDAALNRVVLAKAAYSAAESELIRAERALREAKRICSLYTLSNEYIAKLSVPHS